MFYLDLDELNSLSKRLVPFGKKSSNFFRFSDNDYFKKKPGNHLKEKVRLYLSERNIVLPNMRVMLLTHVRTLGYLFNPVSFYFCFEENESHPSYVIAEVTNTFKEMKLFLLPVRENKANEKVKKNFYVSPFIDLEAYFHFQLPTPGDKLNLKIDDLDKEGKLFFTSSLKGKKKPVTNKILIWYMIRFPLITVGIISKIHWQALRLWFKKIPYIKKSAQQELQQEVINKYQE